jgi:choline-glycine betaine transporter
LERLPASAGSLSVFMAAFLRWSLYLLSALVLSFFAFAPG